MEHMSTLKTYTDCDYIVYLGEALEVCGFELTPDDLQALSIRHHCDEEVDNTIIPPDTHYILEIFGVHTTIIWSMTSDTAGVPSGKLLFYSPNLKELAKEIVNEIENAIPMENNNCVYLNKDNTCRIEKNKPCNPIKCTEFETPTEDKSKFLPMKVEKAATT